MITSYQCDDCGEEYSGQPAADVSRQHPTYNHLCSGCFDDYFEMPEVEPA